MWTVIQIGVPMLAIILLAIRVVVLSEMIETQARRIDELEDRRDVVNGLHRISEETSTEEKTKTRTVEGPVTKIHELAQARVVRFNAKAPK